MEALIISSYPKSTILMDSKDEPNRHFTSSALVITDNGGFVAISSNSKPYIYERSQCNNPVKYQPRKNDENGIQIIISSVKKQRRKNSSYWYNNPEKIQTFHHQQHRQHMYQLEHSHLHNSEPNY